MLFIPILSNISLNESLVQVSNKCFIKLQAWNTDDDIGCVIIKGAGEKAFCAGGDVKCKKIYQQLSTINLNL